MSQIPAPSTAPPRLVVIGQLVGLHGVRGAFKLRSYCEPPERLFRYKEIQLRAPPAADVASAPGQLLRPVSVCSRKVSKEGFIVEFDGIETREHAVPFLGAELVIERSQLPRPRPGEYYWADLEGLKVIGLEGFDFGVVTKVFNTGANDVLTVQGERERLIPFLIPDYVREVDLQAGVLRVDWDPEF